MTATPVESAALAELTSAKQLGSNQEAVRDSVKEYYGEVRCGCVSHGEGCRVEGWSRTPGLVGFAHLPVIARHAVAVWVLRQTANLAAGRYGLTGARCNWLAVAGWAPPALS